MLYVIYGVHVQDVSEFIAAVVTACVNNDVFIWYNYQKEIREIDPNAPEDVEDDDEKYIIKEVELASGITTARELEVLKRDIEEANSESVLLFRERFANTSEVTNLLDSMKKIQEFDVLSILSTVEICIRKFEIVTSKKPHRTQTVWMIFLNDVMEKIELDSPGLYGSTINLEDSMSKIKQFSNLINMLRVKKLQPKIHYIHTLDK